MTRDDKEGPHTGVDYYLQHTYIRPKRNKNNTKITTTSCSLRSLLFPLSFEFDILYVVVRCGSRCLLFKHSQHAALPTTTLVLLLLWLDPPMSTQALTVGKRVARSDRRSLFSLQLLCCCESLAAALPLQQFPNQYVDTRG